MKFVLIISLIFLSGCITMPADVRSYESKTDNVKHVSMEPGWIADSMVKLGLHRSSDMPANTVQIIVAVKNNAASTKGGLTINIDGKRTVLDGLDDLSDVDENGFFRKRFPATVDMVKGMVKGKSVWVKVTHVGQTYQEGEFTKDIPMGAKRGFVKFLEQIK